MKNLTFISSLVLICAVNIKAQTNGNTLSEFLKECYSNAELLDRNNLPPMSLNVMLDIIRKIEDHPNSLGDMRQIATAITHVFRQDGIVFDPTATGTQYIVPYSPTGFPAYKHRLLLTKLIPNNQFKLPENCISSEEKCALHQMVSTSILKHARGDEEWTCNRVVIRGETNAKMRQYRKSDDIEIFDVNGVKDVFRRQIAGITRCPIETGVVSTPWGDVSMGPIIAGVSSGLEEQNVLVSDLVNVKIGFRNNSVSVNNRYASTISGDIAETAIRQGMTRNVISVGANGGWNSTTARRYYFHSKTTDLELTDPEIRGGLDGVILSELAPSYVNKFPEIKLSQFLDMYYSNNGILHELRFRACNRKVLVPDVASTQILTERSLGTAVALYHVSQLSGTTNMRGIENFVQNTITAFNNYLPTNLNDPACLTNTQLVLRPKINLILITDLNVARSQMISYIVDDVEVGKFGSSITLLHPNTGEIVVEKTFSVSNFYVEISKKMEAQTTGLLNVAKVLESLRELSVKELELEKSQHYCGGNSTIALFITDTVPLVGTERVEAIRHATWLRNNVPDLRLVFVAASGNEETVAPLLRDSNDFIPVTLSAAMKSPTLLADISNFLKIMPRRVINPLCGSSWNYVDSGIVGFDDFVDANGINVYRLMPNYFYDLNPERLIRIHSTNHGPISVCYSRTNTYPRRNQTTGTVPGDVVCSSATNEGMVEISLLGACSGFSVEDCSPLYFTVSSTTLPLTPQCKEWGCRYPNDIKFVIAAHELDCFSNSFSIKYNFQLVISLIILCWVLPYLW